MSWLDRWRRSATDAAAVTANPPAGPRRYAVDPDAMCDIALTSSVHELAAIPTDARPDGWAEELLTAAWNASMEIPEVPTFQGPDRFTYLRLQLPRPGTPFQSNCLARQAQHLVDTTCGAALFADPDAEEPVYVLSMGAIESMLLFDDHRGDPHDLAEIAARPDLADKPLAAGEELLFGAPSHAWLTAAEARGLYWHLRNGWGIEDPRIGLFVSPSSAPTRHLVLPTTRAELPDDEEITRLRLRFLTWYLPSSRSLVLRSDGMKVEEMARLADYF